MSVGDIYRFALRSTDVNDQNEVVNVWHFRQVDVLILDTGPQDLAATFIDQVLPEYANCMSSSYTVRDANIFNVTSENEAEIVQIGPYVGTLSGSENIPRQMSPIITWRTGFPGRYRRGRTFMPPITESHQNDGQIGSTLTDNLTEFATELLAMATPSIETAGWQLVVQSYEHDTATTVTSFQVRPIMGVQRKRRFGIGS